MGETAKQGLAWLAAVAAAGFGAVTLQAGGGLLFGPEAAREAAGGYLGFVAWFDFLAGFVYLAGAAGLFLRRRWALWLALALAEATALVLLAVILVGLFGSGLVFHHAVALTVRTAFWLVLAAVARAVAVQ